MKSAKKCKLAFLAVLSLAMLSVDSVLANEYGVIVQLGASKPAATTRWSVDPLTTGIYSEFTPELGVRGFLMPQAGYLQVRFSAGVSYAKWNNATVSMADAGADMVLALDGADVYLGPRFGVLRFSNDHTNSSDNGHLYGLQAGLIIPSESLPALRGAQLELFVRHLRTRAKASRQVVGQTHEVELEHLNTLGAGLIWQFR